MNVIILLGFYYQGDNLLQSSIQDLYRFYKEFSEYGDIYLLTDIDIYDQKYLVNIRNNRESFKIEEFFAKYQNGISMNKKQLKQNLRNILQKHSSQNIVFYFTGHGRSNGILLPDETIFPFIYIRNELTRYLDISKEIIIICDCCQSSSWCLPYIWDNDESMMRLISNDDVVFCSHKILLFNSCCKNQESFSTAKDSLFTYYFVDLVKSLKNVSLGDNILIPSRAKRNISLMVRNIQDKIDKFSLYQNIQVYSSYPISNYIFSWLNPRYENVFQINDRGTMFTFPKFVHENIISNQL